MKTFVKVMLGVVIGGILLIGGCMALVGQGIEEAEKDDKANAISVQEFKSVKQGDTIADVKQALGKPSSRQVTKAAGITTVYLYYPVDNDQFADDYQFVFEDGKLRSKSDY